PAISEHTTPQSIWTIPIPISEKFTEDDEFEDIRLYRINTTYENNTNT
ncbi:28074_t:CDS:2, partial [Racocetra persica]